MGKENAIKIDFMKKENIEEVLAIERASFTKPWSKNLFLSEFRSPSVSMLMVAFADVPSYSVVGYIVCWIIADELHILNLAVEQSFRRRGIAKKLVLSALRQAHQKGAKRAFLEVRSSNTAAKKLYSDLGFNGSSVRRDYYEEPAEDAIVMTLGESAFESLVRVT